MLLDNCDRENWRQATDTTKYLCYEISVANFTLNEYARLIVLLTKDDSLRSAPLESGLHRSKAQLDLNVPRDMFWASKVTHVFNDPEVKPAFDFSGRLARIECSLAPLIARTGDELRKQCEFIRAHFTRSFANWSKSGQNDSANFERFCPLNT